MHYEIRHYQTRPGRRDEWVRFMEEVIIPFQTAQGMDVVASFVDTKSEDGYVWIRRFESDEQSKALYAAVYDSDRWKNEIGPVVEELLFREKIVVDYVTPTPASRLQ